MGMFAEAKLQKKIKQIHSQNKNILHFSFFFFFFFFWGGGGGGGDVSYLLKKMYVKMYFLWGGGGGGG